MIEPSQRVYLDCCAILNVYATRRFDEILVAHRFIVAERVLKDEVLFVRNTAVTSPDREPVDLQPSIERGTLTVERIETAEESATFVNLAVALDDGEAETGALAFHRGGYVATDDAAAIRVLSSLEPAVPVLRTSALLKAWVDREAPDAAIVRAVLKDIRERARFVPGEADPLREWWVNMAA